MTDHHRRFLRIMQQRPAKFHDFTNATLERSILAPNIAELYLRELVNEGYADLQGEFYVIAAKGIAELEKPQQITPAKTFCNAQMVGEYRTPRWNVRDGADQHQQFKSRGHSV